MHVSPLNIFRTHIQNQFVQMEAGAEQSYGEIFKLKDLIQLNEL